MALEYAAAEADTDEWYPYTVTPVTDPKRRIERCFDWGPVMRALLDDTSGAPAIAAKFHNTLAAAVVEVAELAGKRNVLLTGGCFQNRALLARSIRRLRAAGFTPFWPQQYPPNDGGIALGQIMAAIREHGDVPCSTRKTDKYHRPRP